MKRNSLITTALIIAAVLLAILLFVAGAVWRGRVSRRPAAGLLAGVQPGTTHFSSTSKYGGSQQCKPKR
jgi:hypothetical protein